MRTEALSPSPSAFGATKITQMSLARGLRPCGFHEAAALAFRRRAGHLAHHVLAGAGWTFRRIGKADQQFDIFIAIFTMVTVKRHGQAPRPFDRKRSLEAVVQDPDQSEVPDLAAEISARTLDREVAMPLGVLD